MYNVVLIDAAQQEIVQYNCAAYLAREERMT